jgi:hypothetical protein
MPAARASFRLALPAPGRGSCTSEAVHVVPINTSIALGSSVHDLATVTGFAPTGNVTFTFYRGGDCTTGTAEAAGTVALVAVNATMSVAHPSTSKLAFTAGDYAFKATYAGDGTNIGSASDCEPFSVSEGNLNVATFIHLDGDHVTNYDRNATGNETASVAVNSTVHDVAVVSGAVTDIAPSGAITFTRWNNGTCTGDGIALAANGADESETGTKSADFGPLAPGTYSFKATIAADANYNTATSPCEQLVVDQAQSGIGTQPDAALTFSADLTDSATVTGVAPTGTVTFRLFSDDDCETEVYSEAVPLPAGTDNSKTVSTTAFEVTTAGTWYWTAVYGGDTNNAGSTSDCGAESVTITAPSFSTVPVAP